MGSKKQKSKAFEFFPRKDDNPVNKVLEQLAATKPKTVRETVNTILGLSSDAARPLFIQENPYTPFDQLDAATHRKTYSAVPTGTPGSIKAKLGNIFYLTDVDKYGVVRNLDNYSVSPAGSVFKSLGSQPFSIVTSNLDPSEKYISYKTKLIPIPTSVGSEGRLSRVLKIGKRVTGSSNLIDLTYGSSEQDYMSLFLKEVEKISLEETDPNKIFRKLQRIQKRVVGRTLDKSSGLRNITLGSLLQKSGTARGRTQSLDLASSASLKSVVSFSGEDVPEELMAFRKLENAKAALNMIVKTRGRVASSDIIPSEYRLRPGERTKDLIRRIHSDIRKHSKYVASLFEKLGIKDAFPLGKPDYLVGDLDKNISVPAKQAVAMYKGLAYGPRAGTKSLSQLYNFSTLSSDQLKSLSTSGLSRSPVYQTKAEAEWLGGSVNRRAAKALVLDFATEADELKYIADSGSLVTPSGVLGSKRQLFLGSIKLKNVNERAAENIEKFFGVDTTIVGSQVGNTFDYTRQEVLEAMEIAKKSTSNIYYNKNRFKHRKSKKSGRIFKYYEILDETRKATPRIKELAKLLKTLGKKQSGMVLSAASKGVPFTATVQRVGDDLNIHFNTLENQAASHAEMILGLQRTTGSVITKDNPLFVHYVQKGLVPNDVEYIVPRSLVNKSHETSPQTFLTNFFDYLSDPRRAAMAKEAYRFMGLDYNDIRHKQNIDTTIIDDEASAYSKALQFLETHFKDRKPRLDAVLRRINFGKRVKATDATNLPGVTGASVMRLDQSLRADELMDIGSKNLRVGLGKLKTLAIGAKFLGYDDPNKSPLFKLFAMQFEAKGINFSSDLFDFTLSEEHFLKKFLKPLHDESFIPEKSDVVTFRDGKTFLGDKEIKSLPHPKFFKHSQGGVPESELAGTLLDKSLSDRVFYIDRGEAKRIGVLGLENKTRYVPVSMDLLRASRGSGGRVVISSNHSANSFIQGAYRLLAASMDKGPGGAEIRKLAEKDLESALLKQVENIPTKEGLLNKTSIYNVKESQAARLISDPTSSAYRDLFNVEKVFELQVSRKSLKEELYKKLGYDDKDIESILRNIESSDDIYVMMNVDPTQRYEHIGQVFRLNIVDRDYAAPAGTKIVEEALNIVASPIAHASWSRDVDRDRAVVAFVEDMLKSKGNMSRGMSREYLKKVVKQQQEMFEPYMAIAREAMSKAGTMGSVVKASMEESLPAALSQKMFASIGYTMTRPEERLLPLILSRGAEGLAKMGVNINEDVSRAVEFTRSKFAKDTKRLYAGNILAEYLFQGGVQKGDANKIPAFEELQSSLQELADRVKEKSISLEQGVQQSEQFFKNFIDTQKVKHFSTASYLLNSEANTTEENALLEGLLKGADYNAETVSKARNILNTRAAKLLSETVGLSYMVSGFVPGIKNLMSVVEDQTPVTSENFWSRIVEPVVGKTRKIATGLMQSSGPQPAKSVDDAGPGSFKKNLSDLASSAAGVFQKVLSSKFFAPALVGAGLVGAYGYGNALGSSQLPPPIDTSTPIDRGPAIPNYANTARINSSKTIASAGSNRHMTQISPVSSNYFDAKARTRVTIEDKIKPTNPYLIRQQMDRVSESDFVY